MLIVAGSQEAASRSLEKTRFPVGVFHSVVMIRYLGTTPPVATSRSQEAVCHSQEMFR